MEGFVHQTLKLFESHVAEKHNNNTLLRAAYLAVNTIHLFMSLEIRLKCSFPLGATEIFPQISCHSMTSYTCRIAVVPQNTVTTPLLAGGEDDWLSCEETMPPSGRFLSANPTLENQMWKG